MNSLFKSKLEILAEDAVLLSAIQEVFNEVIEVEKPVVMDSYDNNLLGEKYRAYEKAKDMIHTAVLNIQSYKNNKDNNNSFNKAQ